MLAAHVKIFLASLKRCLAVPGFLEDFYREFLDSSDEVREKFRDTDFRRQARVLEESLYVLANMAQGAKGSPAWGNLQQIADRHSRKERDIRPELYDQWLACLLEAVRRHDPEFTAEIEDSWRQTLAVGIDYMRSRYQGSSQ